MTQNDSNVGTSNPTFSDLMKIGIVRVLNQKIDTYFFLKPLDDAQKKLQGAHFSFFNKASTVFVAKRSDCVRWKVIFLHKNKKIKITNILVFRGFGKKIGRAPSVSPS
jgi:hypothetical protein